ncbi:amine oxidase [Pedobacter sp. HMF7647]|uniref:Amine oxidase n=2 Tax=Hufsiella arboris TaxID=2695275 RepID=A0A7K1Y7P5_9SPHI|nr:amine oxidase [Hufsiella arboris]
MASPFTSFWMAGFECADHLNSSRQRVSLLKETAHDLLVKHDYERLKAFGINAVREGICWSEVEISPYKFDFSRLERFIEAAEETGIQQIWDICHFGFPDDLNPMNPHFKDRFVALCDAFATFFNLNKSDDTFPFIVTPINEVSFLSWLGGEAAETEPYLKGEGWNVKYQLMKAYIAGIEVLKKIDPDVKILTTEPIVNIVPPLNADDFQINYAAEQHELQYQSLDMLCGRICPELGGKPGYPDILGFNYYYNNQWISGFKEFLPWVNTAEDMRWRPLSSLLEEAYSRYEKPMIISETSHPGVHRPEWLNFITEQCIETLSQKIPLLGACLYPIIDRPDWNDITLWHHAGLWDHDGMDANSRDIYEPYARCLNRCEKLLKADDSLISYEDIEIINSIG